MSDREFLFLKTAATVEDEAGVLRDLLGLEPIPHQATAGEDEFGLRGPARTVDGTLGFVVHPNGFAEIDPDPGDIQVFDAYEVQIDIWLGSRGPQQQAEARVVFDHLVAHRPDVPMLLCHNPDWLIAAYLPGRGVHDFPPGTSVDAPDAEQWRDWAVTS
ncbi:hypothetical protein [Kribbella sp. NPDC006257]|uniref:hypothetical protein n=1 Tax=Kribbella sp. NPDC006257 TaxID=3156738 RepID=UPI0033A37E30